MRSICNLYKDAKRSSLCYFEQKQRVHLILDSFRFWFWYSLKWIKCVRPKSLGFRYLKVLWGWALLYFWPCLRSKFVTESKRGAFDESKFGWCQDAEIEQHTLAYMCNVLELMNFKDNFQTFSKPDNQKFRWTYSLWTCRKTIRIWPKGTKILQNAFRRG